MSRPLHFFGSLGLINMSAGSAVALWLLMEKVLYRTNVVERNALLLAFAAVSASLLRQHESPVLISLATVGRKKNQAPRRQLARNLADGMRRHPPVDRADADCLY